MKILIPIEIKSEEDLPKKIGNYIVVHKSGKIEERHFNKKIWLKYIKIWHKEVSENEYLKEKKLELLTELKQYADIMSDLSSETFLYKKITSYIDKS